MNIKIAICDDEANQIWLIRSLVQKWSRTFDCKCDISVFSSAEAFLFEYSENRAYDILLLDVQMNEISGIELAKRIRNDNSRAEIIFISSHFEYAGEGYDVEALNFLTKPINEEKLFFVLNRAKERVLSEPAYVIITSNGETMKLYEDKIIYIESFRHYVYVRTENDEHRVKENISDFQERLSADFFRIHRSYIVSLKKITKITRRSVFLGKLELPLSRDKYDEVNRAFIERN